MGREVRRVPPDWKHPIKGKYPDGKPRYVPLFDGADFERHERDSVEDGDVPAPEADWYMPRWSPEEATHYQMYETCSEGTPISPIFATPEELARWLADTGASAFGEATASYEGWLQVVQGKPSIGAVLIIQADGSGEWVSGVDAALMGRSADKEG